VNSLVGELDRSVEGVCALGNTFESLAENLSVCAMQIVLKVANTVSTAIWLARSPAARPPMPSHTTKIPRTSIPLLLRAKSVKQSIPLGDSRRGIIYSAAVEELTNLRACEAFVRYRRSPLQITCRRVSCNLGIPAITNYLEFYPKRACITCSIYGLKSGARKWRRAM